MPLPQYWGNIGPSSTTLDKHYPSIGSVTRACWYNLSLGNSMSVAYIRLCMLHTIICHICGSESTSHGFLHEGRDLHNHTLFQSQCPFHHFLMIEPQRVHSLFKFSYIIFIILTILIIHPNDNRDDLYIFVFILTIDLLLSGAQRVWENGRYLLRLSVFVLLSVGGSVKREKHTITRRWYNAVLMLCQRPSNCPSIKTSLGLLLDEKPLNILQPYRPKVRQTTIEQSSSAAQWLG